MKQGNLLKFFAIAVVACGSVLLSREQLPAFSSQVPPQTQTVPRNGFYFVRQVVDGDGIRVWGIDQEIRFACVNAEELPLRWGTVARDHLMRRLPPFTLVILRFTGGFAGSRPVAEVYHFGSSINLEMVGSGLAVVYPRFLWNSIDQGRRIVNCSATANAYLSSERTARLDRRGIWSLSNPTTVNVPYPGCFSGRPLNGLSPNSDACLGRR